MGGWQRITQEVTESSWVPGPFNAQAPTAALSGRSVAGAAAPLAARLPPLTQGPAAPTHPHMCTPTELRLSVQLFATRLPRVPRACGQDKCLAVSPANFQSAFYRKPPSKLPCRMLNKRGNIDGPGQVAAMCPHPGCRKQRCKWRRQRRRPSPPPLPPRWIHLGSRTWRIPW